MSDLQRECRKRALWPGGSIGNLKDRLLRNEFAPATLLPSETQPEEIEIYQPDYYAVVKKPIDLTAIKGKVEERKYRTLTAMEEDINLLLANTRAFDQCLNPGGSQQVCKDTEVIEAVLQREMASVKAMAVEAQETNKRLLKSQRDRDRKRLKRERQTMLGILNKLMQAKDDCGRQLAKPFMKVPPKKNKEYHKKIAKPIDFTMIRTNIESNVYADTSALGRDLVRIISNARQCAADGQNKEKVNSLEELVHDLLGSNMPKASGQKIKRKRQAAAAAANKQMSRTDVLLQIWHAIRALKDGQRDRTELFLQLPSKSSYPNYYRVIKQPIDLETIRRKIETRKYRQSRDPFSGVDKDMQLLLDNARRYNEPDSQIIEDAGEIHNVYEEQKRIGLLLLTSRSGDWQGLPNSASLKFSLGQGTAATKKCLTILQRLIEMSGAEPFANPVDREEFPQYYSVVSHPMDFNTIITNLIEHKYRHVGLLSADVHLTLNNLCIATDPGSAIAKAAESLRSHFERFVSADFGHSSKKNVTNAGAAKGKRGAVLNTALSGRKKADKRKSTGGAQPATKRSRQPTPAQSSAQRKTCA
jgi:hypothetical protein